MAQLMKELPELDRPLTIDSMKNWHTPSPLLLKVKALAVFPFLPQIVAPHQSPWVTAHSIPSLKPLQMRARTCLHWCRLHLWCPQPEPLIPRQSPPLAADGTQRKIKGPKVEEVLVANLTLTKSPIPRSAGG